MSISKIKIGSTTHDIVAGGITYCTCATAADAAAKVATVASGSFTLFTGAVIVVKFTYANSVASPTLNVAGTGAKTIVRYGTTKISTGTTTSGWVAGALQLFVYDGTYWVRDYWYNTTYSNFVKSGEGAKAGLVPAPSTTAGTTKYLREDGTWQVPPNLAIGTTSTTAAAGNHTHSDYAASSHAHGNITSSGTITATAVTSATGVLVYDSNNKIQRATAANARSIIGAGTSNLAIGTTSTTAAAGNHTHSGYAGSTHAHGNVTSSGTITSTAVTSATGVLVYDSSNKIQRATAANARAIIGAGTSNLAIGTTSTTAAAGNHTHSGYAPAYTYSTTDLTAGSSSLTTGKLYFVYE